MFCQRGREQTNTHPPDFTNRIFIHGNKLVRIQRCAVISTENISIDRKQAHDLGTLCCPARPTTNNLLKYRRYPLPKNYEQGPALQQQDECLGNGQHTVRFLRGPHSSPPDKMSQTDANQHHVASRHSPYTHLK